ncbi:peptidylprolyl isomerase [Phormidesmis priestleyi ULC007]|uniref:peptidylprolyl isomerase n=1 Tax=Phormidesmis priestleyi ULC007 TaxID=1920490 RepID=A0A2T1D7R8_9CYAN|nr:peptidylprolyl isomerase [Phormidesmis priestleyi]PSB16491.1 peptidylprolyl isomerase [Phormidesmis priestleyi ULC007]PZO48568.1 MAG: peptidylprolyl isomerase [Phormidesmis priestleyi]
MQTKIRNWLLSTLAVAIFAIVGCNPQATSAPTDSPSASPSATASVPAVVPSSPQANNLPRLEGKATVVMTVKGSPITIEVNGTDAPITSGNFVDLVDKKVYDGLVFHRVVREPQPFVVQGGDPQGKNPNFPLEQLGTGGFIDPTTNQPRNIPLEIKPDKASEPIVYSKTLESKNPKLKHIRGAVAMARSAFPDSASSQFYFVLADQPFLDGDYAVFGTVTQGMEGVDKIQQGDRIESAKVTQGIENLKRG